MRSIRILNFPGKQFVLEYSAAPDSSALSLAEHALQSLRVFTADFCEVLTADVHMVLAETEFLSSLQDAAIHPEFCLARPKDLHPGIDIQTIWTHQQERCLQYVSFPALHEWLASMLGPVEPQSKNTCRSWDELLFRTTMLRLPLDCHFEIDSIRGIRVEQDGYELWHPVLAKEDTLWIAGPWVQKTLRAPIEFSFTHDARYLTLTITLRWSLWTDPEWSGFDHIRQALARLGEMGWTQRVPASP